MARIFRQTYSKPLPQGAQIITRKGKRLARYKDHKGRTQTAPLSADGTKIIRKTSRYYIDYRDGSGEPRRVAGFTDKLATEQKAAELERRGERQRAGIIDQQSVDLSRHLRRGIGEHIDAYRTHLQASGVSPWHLSETIRRLRAVISSCSFTKLQDIGAGPVQQWCTAKQSEGMSARTRNTYTGSLRAFARWCVAGGRVPSDPLRTLTKADESADVRRARRALTEAELAKLMRVAELRPLAENGRETVRKPVAEVNGDRKTWTKAPLTPDTIALAAARAAEKLRCKPARITQLKRLGHERGLIYRTLVLTGLRRGELGALRWGDMSLDSPQAWLTIRAAVAKNHKAETLPIRADLANALRAWRAENGDPPDSATVFHVPKQLVNILDRDLAAAGISKADAEGRTIDVHAMRHTTATYLAKAGVAPRTAQGLMRHSDIRLTLGTYTDPRLLDEAAALDALPRLDLGGHDEPRQVSGRS